MGLGHHQTGVAPPMTQWYENPVPPPPPPFHHHHHHHHHHGHHGFVPHQHGATAAY
ncbi:unnamed protein product [Nesidiocoris tenuis]|nr:unnamed protein product [Nesidiocoris tenuis]